MEHAMRRADFYNRKRMVHLASCAAFVISTILISLILAEWHKKSLAWVKNGYLAQGTIVNLDNNPSKLNTLLQRARLHTAFAITYSVKINNALFKKNAYVDQHVYASLSEGKSVPVYIAKNGEQHNLKSNIDDQLAQSHLIYYLSKTAVITVPVSLIFHALLMLIFVRTRANILLKGFYTKHSWLNTNDNVLIWLTHSQIIVIRFEKHQTKMLAQLYQQEACLDDLIAKLKRPNIYAIDIADINAIESEYASPKLLVSTANRAYKLSFMNYGLKHHALTQIAQHLPAHLIHSVNKKSRIMGFMPWFLLSVLCVAAVLQLNNHALMLIIAAIFVLKLLPKCIFHICSPREVQRWRIPDI